MKIAEHCKPGRGKKGEYTPVCDWPEECYVQWGDSGIVFKSNKMGDSIETLAKALSGDSEAVAPAAELMKHSYVTAFFEVFPTEPSTFIRGEGESVEAAERAAFAKLQRYLACSGHEFERRNYTNGAGFCKHCGLFKSKAFEPTTRCHQCNTPTYYSVDREERYWCETCEPSMPKELWPDWKARWRAEDEETS